MIYLDWCSLQVWWGKKQENYKKTKNQHDFLFCLLDNTTHKTYIMMEARLGALFKSESEYTILEKWVQRLYKWRKR